MEKKYQYMAKWDGSVPALIRLGPMATMEADMYSYPGQGESMPHLNDIRVGGGSFMDYDNVTAEEAEELLIRIQERFDRIAAERKKQGRED